MENPHQYFQSLTLNEKMQYIRNIPCEHGSTLSQCQRDECPNIFNNIWNKEITPPVSGGTHPQNVRKLMPPPRPPAGNRRSLPELLLQLQQNSLNVYKTAHNACHVEIDFESD